MKTKKLIRLFLCILLINISAGSPCLADGKSKQKVTSQDDLTIIRQQIEKLTAKNKVRIQLKSQEKIVGRIHEQHADSISIQTGKEDNPQLREVAYRDIKSIRSEEKLSAGIKVLSLVMTIAIVGAFAVLTHHRSR